MALLELCLGLGRRILALLLSLSPLSGALVALIVLAIVALVVLAVLSLRVPGCSTGEAGMPNFLAVAACVDVATKTVAVVGIFSAEPPLFWWVWRGPTKGLVCIDGLRSV